MVVFPSQRMIYTALNRGRGVAVRLWSLPGSCDIMTQYYEKPGEVEFYAILQYAYSAIQVFSQE